MAKEEKYLLRRIREIQEAQRVLISGVVAQALNELQAGEAPATKAD